MLGHIAQPQLGANPLKCLLGELGTVWLAVLGGEHPLAEFLGQGVNGGRDPVRNREGPGLTTLGLACCVGAELRAEPSPLHPKRLRLTKTQPNHDPQQDRYMRVPCFAVYRSKEILHPHDWHHGAGLLLDLQLGHVEWQCLEVEGTDTVVADRLEGAEGVVRIGGRAAALQHVSPQSSDLLGRQTLDGQSSHLGQHPQPQGAFSTRQMPLGKGRLVDGQPLLDQFPDSDDPCGPPDLPVEQFLALVLHDCPSRGQVRCSGRSVDPLPVDLQAVVPEATDLLESLVSDCHRALPMRAGLCV